MDVFERAASVLRGAGQELRLKILYTLVQEGPKSFSDMLYKFNLTSGVLNFHIRKLREANLVTVGNSGLYQATDVGKWLITRLYELPHVEERGEIRLTLIDARGAPFEKTVSALASELAELLSTEPRTVEEAILRFYSLLRDREGPVDVGFLIDFLLIDLGAFRSDTLNLNVHLPASTRNLILRSYIDEDYSFYRSALSLSVIARDALARLSGFLSKLWSEKILFIRPPVYLLGGAHTVVVNVPGIPVTRLVSRLYNLAEEIVLIVDKVDEDAFELLDSVADRGRISIVFSGGPPPAGLRPRNIMVIVHGGEEWHVDEEVLNLVNAPSPIIFARGGNLPSPKLALLPPPPPGTVHVVGMHMAVLLNNLYRETMREAFDVTELLAQVSEEASRVLESYSARRVVQALGGITRRVDVLEPQISLLGFEEAMTLHHERLTINQLEALSSRFWSYMRKVFAENGATVTAALADERAYIMAGESRDFNPVSAYSLARRDRLESLARLEGIVQSILGGGSLLHIKAKSYLDGGTLTECLKTASLHHVSWMTVGLEFTACNSCGHIVLGRQGLCPSCLSERVTKLAKPLTLYMPVEALPREALEEYQSRKSLA